MNFCIQMGFISVVRAFSSMKKTSYIVSPFFYSEMHCLCSGILDVGDISTCPLSNAELLCDLNIFHY